MNNIQRKQEAATRQIERTISVVLQVGVTLSALIILLGLVLFFSHTTNGSYHYYTSVGYAFLHTPQTLLASLRAGTGIGYIEFGLLLLILTPVFRVAVSILSFIAVRDKRMTAVTAFVLIALLSSFGVGIAVK